MTIGKPPEGREPLLWSDMDFALPKNHPSTWEAEAKALRTKNERLHRRAQKAEGRIEAALFAVRSWRKLDVGPVTARLALKEVEEILTKQKEGQSDG